MNLIFDLLVDLLRKSYIDYGFNIWLIDLKL